MIVNFILFIQPMVLELNLRNISTHVNILIHARMPKNIEKKVGFHKLLRLLSWTLKSHKTSRKIVFHC